MQKRSKVIIGNDAHRTELSRPRRTIIGALGGLCYWLGFLLEIADENCLPRQAWRERNERRQIMFGKSAKLTARGHEQAKFIAQRCVRLPIEVIISSGFLRADETARYIVDAVGKPLEQSDLFAERRHPSFPPGRSKSEPDYVAFEEGFWNKFDDPSWRHEDAENFDDLNARAQAALRLLAGRPEKNVLVVGHGLFTKVLAAKVVFGDGLTGSECIKVLRAFRLENTGLSVFEHDPEHAGASVWRIAVWNDHAH